MPDSPQLLLPFAEKDYVDMKHAARILGVHRSTVLRLTHAGLLDMVRYHDLGWPRVRYRSIVEFCDNLRSQFKIPDRRPVLAPALRYKDEDVLPFPLGITMGTYEALSAMGSANDRVMVPLIEEGRFEAYRLAWNAPWRISRPSFAAYLESAHKHPNRPYARDILSTECSL